MFEIKQKTLILIKGKRLKLNIRQSMYYEIAHFALGLQLFSSISPG